MPVAQGPSILGGRSPTPGVLPSMVQDGSCACLHPSQWVWRDRRDGDSTSLPFGGMTQNFLHPFFFFF